MEFIIPHFMSLYVIYNRGSYVSHGAQNYSMIYAYAVSFIECIDTRN